MLHPLEERIAAIRRQVRRLVLVHAGAWLVGVTVAALLALGLLDFLLRLQDRGIRVILSLSVAGLICWVLYRFLLPAALAQFRDVDLALRLEKRFPQLSDRLSSTVQFLKQAEDDEQAGSATLRRAVISQTWADLEQLDLSQAIERRPTIRAAAVASLVCLLALVFCAADRHSAQIALARMINPFGNARWPQVHHLAFRDPPRRIASGDRFEVTLIDARGKPFPADVRIHFRYEGDDAEQVQAMQLVGDALVASKDNVTRPFSYRAVGGDYHSMEWIPLAVVDAPAVDSLSITLHYPEYSGMQPAKADQRISALEGTRIELKGTVTRRLRSASVRHDSGAVVPLAIAADGHGFSLSPQADPSFVVEKSGSYWFELGDLEGLVGGRDIRYDMQAIPDAAPAVLIEQPAANVYVTPSAVVPLKITVKEDLAIKDVDLRFTRTDRTDVGEFIVPLYLGPDRAAAPADGARGESRTLEYAWDLAQPDQSWSGLKPGVVVRFLSTARDYKPQAGQSTPRQLTIITPEELEERIAERQSFILAELGRVLKLQQESRSQVQGLEIQMEQVGKLTRQDADHLQGAQLLQQQVDRGLTSDTEGIPGHIASLIADLENNRLETPDVRRRLQEISDEFSRLGKQQLPVIRREMTAALKGAQARPAESAAQDGSDKAVGQSIAETSKQQDQVIASLEGLMGELAQWDGFRRFSRDVGQLLRDQEQLTRETAEAGRETITQELNDLTPQQQADLKKLAQRQTELARRLEETERQMRQSQSDMENDEPLSAASISDALEHARRKSISGQMRSSGQSVERNQVGQAAVGQQQAASDLQEMLDILSHRKEHELSQLVKKLKEAEQELSALRKQQEGLRKKILEAAKNPDEQQRRRELQRLAREERELQQQAERLARRLQRLQAEQAGQQIGQAAGKMGQSGQQGEEGDASGASEQATQAAKDLDEAQQQLAERRRQAEMDLAREQLAQIEDSLKGLAERQQKVIDETRRLDEIKQTQGRLTRGQAASLQGLAGEQDAVREETAGLSTKIAAAEVFSLALDGSAAEMQRAVTLLNQRDCGQPTQTAEQNALRRFQQLLESLKPDAEQGQQQQNQQAGGQGGQQGGPQGDAVRMLAELKMLKLLQQEINTRTQSLDEKFRSDQQLTQEEEREYVRLGEEQGKLADLALNFAQPSEPEGKDDPAAIPELDDVLPGDGNRESGIRNREEGENPEAGDSGQRSEVRGQRSDIAESNLKSGISNLRFEIYNPQPSTLDSQPAQIRNPQSAIRNLLMAQQPPTAPKQQAPAPEDPLLKKLNEDLLNDLDKELFDGPPQPKNKPTADAPAGKTPSADPELDRELMRGLEGEDIGKEQADPLVTVGRRMREVESLIAGKEAGQTTQELQQQIVKELDELIRDLRQRSQSQSASSSSQQRQQTRSGKVQQPGETPSQSQQLGKQPARDSSSRLSQNKAQRPDPEAMREMMKRVWGHLPQREREQMQQSLNEQFLPQYELQIEQYFKALVEQPAQQP
jgi:hypothetical protein